MQNEWDVIVIGGGAAGLSAAQMLGRSRRRTLVIDSAEPRNRFAAHMHGVLGHDGVDPRVLLERGRAEVGAYGVEVVQGTVVSVSDEGNRVRVEREDGSVDGARALVIAAGIVDDLPAIPGLAAGWGSTVLHCPYCHGWEVSDQRLAVLATSPMSVHQAQLVRQLSADVTFFAALAGPLDDDVTARFIAREVTAVTPTVARVEYHDDGVHVITVDGEKHVVDAIFTGGIPRLNLGFADQLGLDRSELPGAPLAVDMMGRTSHPRVFAAGNTVSPFANVPVSMGAGSMAGAGANAILAEEDFAAAVERRAIERNAGWEERYAAEDRFWSGDVNATVAAIVTGLTPGDALDIGSGEGGDVVWLAEHGWRATGVDVSETAVRRASELAAERGVDALFVVGDGVDAVEDSYDLVLASFLHSWEPDFPRVRILRDAAARVRHDGRLLVVSHVAPPPWVDEPPAHMPVLRTPEQEIALLDLDPGEWTPEVVEVRRRPVTAPDGTPSHLDDGVLLLRRRAQARDRVS